MSSAEKEVLQNFFINLGFDHALLLTNELDLVEYIPIEKREMKFFATVVNNLNPSLVLELGTWQGKSALAWSESLLAKAQSQTTEPILVCVDTWLGSWEHLLDFNPNSEWGKSRLKLDLGRPTFYLQFLKVLQMNKSGKIIYPLSATTETCFEIFSRLNVRFEVIYIDASHDYAPVYRDIDSSFEILADTGVLIGDDFENWDSVKQAVKDFASLKGLKLLAGEGQWMLYSENNDCTRKLVSELYSCGWADVEIPSQTPSIELLFQREISKNYLLQVQANELKLIKESSIFKLMSIWHQIKKRLVRIFQK